MIEGWKHQMDFTVKTFRAGLGPLGTDHSWILGCAVALKQGHAPLHEQKI